MELSRRYLPCLHCDSSDAVSLLESGSGKCFSCGEPAHISQYDNTTTLRSKTVRPYSQESVEDVSGYDTTSIPERKISKYICEFFDVKMSYDPSGTVDCHYYPYYHNGKLVAYKTRKLPKDFRSIGNMKETDLFGKHKFTPGGRMLVITEGELDCLAVAQATYQRYKTVYPVVSLPSSSSLGCLLSNRNWIRSFGIVILMFDQDEAGEKAIEKAAKIIGWDKVRIAYLQENDPCDTFIKYGPESLISSTFNARPYTPASIVRGEDIWEAYRKRKLVKSLPYPDCLEGLNEKLEGMRFGEITLFTSGTGAGKSSVMKEIILHIKESTDHSIGLISLEESIGDSAEKFMSMVMTKDPSEEEERKAFDNIFKDERLILLDHNGSVSDSSLIDQIEGLCLLGCKYLVLDHITIAVSEGAEGKTGNEAIDSVMSSLLKIVKKHDIWLGIVSHLRKSQGKSFEEGNLSSIDDIKGSGSIKQISFDIVTFSRNITAESEEERNVIHLRVLKSRFTGRTGDCGTATYDTETKRLKGKVDFMEY